MIRPKPADGDPVCPRRWAPANILPIVGSLIVLILAGCGSATEVGSDTGIDPQDPARVEAGSALFAANCASCHGLDVRGTNQGPSLLSVVYEPNHHADFSFVLAAQRGVPQHHWGFGDMPPIGDVTVDEMEKIVAFVRETQRLEGFEPYSP